MAHNLTVQDDTSTLIKLSFIKHCGHLVERGMHADSPKNDRQSLDVANTLRLTPGELLLETQPVMLRVTVDTCGTVMDPAVGTRSHDVQPLHQPISLPTLSSPSHTPQHPTPAFAELPALSCGTTLDNGAGHQS